MIAALLLAAAVLATPAGTAAAERAALLAGPVDRGHRSGRQGVTGHPSWRRGTAVARLWAAVPTGVRARLTPPVAAPEDLPRAVDLLAVCLAAGLPTHAALDAVAEALDGRSTVGAALGGVAGRLRLGADPRSAWAQLPAETAPHLRPVAEALGRSAEAGGAAGPALDHAAQRLRAEVDAAALARAERAGVMVAGPLGLCFLPAFVCLGVVPVVLGLAGRILPGLGP